MGSLKRKVGPLRPIVSNEKRRSFNKHFTEISAETTRHEPRKNLPITLRGEHLIRYNNSFFES